MTEHMKKNDGLLGKRHVPKKEMPDKDAFARSARKIGFNDQEIDVLLELYAAKLTESET